MKWTENQLQAINESGSNIIVSAGAGSGKTAVLSERVLRILNDGVDIRNILILTFTNEAAGEMKERIRKKIKKNNLTNQLINLDQASITTFDAYALSLVKKYHYKLNIDSNIKIIDSSIITLEKERILDEIFSEYYEDKNELFLKLIRDFTNRDDDTIKEAILSISSTLDLKYNKEEYIDNYLKDFYNKENIESLFNEYFMYLKNLCNKIEDDVYILSNSLEEKDALKLSVFKNIFNPNNYDDVYNNIDITMPRFSLLDDDLKKTKDDLKETLNELKDLASLSKEELINNLYSTKDYIEIILNIIKELDEKIFLYKKDKSAFEFNDIAKLAIKIVSENNEIKEELKNKYVEIMIDEYQDTSDLQEAFISLIENNNLYMVGDIKQSIYRFRNANPDIFKNKYENYKNNNNGKKIDLLKNFRSRSEVLNNINEIFNLIMSMEVGSVDYKDNHEMIFGNMVYTNNFINNYDYNMKLLKYKNEDKIYTNSEIEAFIIANDIKNKIENKHQVYDIDCNALRNAIYSDFCIILDRNTDMGIYKKIFEYLHIPLVIYKDENLVASQDILIIKNILNLILTIKDKDDFNLVRYYYTSIARSFLFNLSDEEIFKTLKDNKIYNSIIYEKCYKLSLNISLKTPSIILEEILDEFNFYENLINIGNIKEAKIRLEYLMNLSDEISNLGLNIKEFASFLNEIISKKKEIRYKEGTEKGNSVKIMNIHKSKGLEFPICYFAGLYKKFNIRDINSRFLFDNNYGILSPYFKEGIGTTFLKTLIKNKYYDSEISEKVRLFYVALTRAKEEIIMVLPEFKSEEKRTKPLDYLRASNCSSFYDFLNTISINLKKYSRLINLNDLDITHDYDKSTNNKDIIKTNRKLILKENKIESIKIENKHASKTVYELLKIKDQEKMDYGTNIHEMLEESNLKVESDNPIIKNLQENFDFKKAIIYQELEFIYEFENKEYHGIIDLMLEYEKEIKIIDYKLKNIDDEEYINQLKVYYNYIKSIKNKSIKVYLYSIIDNKIKELDVNI